jgi:hypothetical protein
MNGQGRAEATWSTPQNDFCGAPKSFGTGNIPSSRQYSRKQDLNVPRSKASDKVRV